MTPRNYFVIMCLSDITEQHVATNKALATKTSIKMESMDGKQLVDFFYSQRSAESEAKRLATLNPSKVYSVLGTISFFETAPAEVIEKQVTSAGEFVMKMKETPKKSGETFL